MRWPWAAVVVLALAVGLPTIRTDNYFFADDFGLVQHLHDLPAERLLSYFTSDWTEGIYGTQLDELRPVLAFSYWLDAHIFGTLNATGYHVTNVRLHLLNALLVLAIARSVAPREPLFAVLAASLFALTSSHAEPIAWISGRVDSLVAVFYLGAFLCFVRFRLSNRLPWLCGALLLFVGGLFTKQSAVTFPLLVAAFDAIGIVPGPEGRGRRAVRLWPHLLFFGIAAAYLALRQALFSNAVREDLLTLATVKEFINRQERYATELLPSPNRAPKVLKTLGEVVTVLVAAVCLWWMATGRRAQGYVARRVLFFGVVWWVVTIAPMIVTYLSARHLYITAAGVSIMLASLVLPGGLVEEPRRVKIRKAMAGTLVVLYAVASIWNVAWWVASGVESGKFASALPRLLGSVPRGSIVFVDVPWWHREGWFWSFATPFAVQAPFTGEDLNQKFRIVEQAEVYCCPPPQWWEARKTTLQALTESKMPQQVVYIEFAPEDAGARLTTRTVDGPVLKGRIESVLGDTIEQFAPAAMTPERARELNRVLFEP